MIQALQAVANYPESRDFVETVSRQMPDLQNFLGTTGKREGCLVKRENQGQSTNPTTPGTSATRHRAPSSIPGLSPVSDEELGRKRAWPHELAQSASNSDSPTSRSPLDKQRNNVLRYVVIQGPPKVGYRGVPEPQMTMSEVMERYAPSHTSVPESTDNSAPSSSSSTTKSGKKSTAPSYFPQSDNVSRSVVTRDANRIWQVASRLNERQFRDRQRVPPSSASQAQLRKLSIITHLSQTLRVFDADTGEAAWEQRVVRQLTMAHDNYLRPMQNNLNEQCSARCSLQPGETRETHSRYPRCLEAMKPISKETIQRTRSCVMIDSTVPCDLPLDNPVLDVLIVTLPLSQLPEMAEVDIAKFSPELEGPQKEPPPRRIIFANLMDHKASEVLLDNLPRMLREMSTKEAARNEVIEVVHQVATAMERTAELLRTHLKVPALFVSPHVLLYWGGMFQQFVYMLTEVAVLAA